MKFTKDSHSTLSCTWQPYCNLVTFMSTTVYEAATLLLSAGDKRLVLVTF